MIGTNLVIQEESYTSKCDVLAFKEVWHHDKYKKKSMSFLFYWK